MQPLLVICRAIFELPFSFAPSNTITGAIPQGYDLSTFFGHDTKTVPIFISGFDTALCFFSMVPVPSTLFFFLRSRFFSQFPDSVFMPIWLQTLFFSFSCRLRVSIDLSRRIFLFSFYTGQSPTPARLNLRRSPYI